MSNAMNYSIEPLKDKYNFSAASVSVIDPTRKAAIAIINPFKG